jgi:hypothetical protein
VVFLEGTYFVFVVFLLVLLWAWTPLTSFSVLNTVDDTTKGLPVVGGVTSPLLKTVGGVTDGLPVVSLLSPVLQLTLSSRTL